MITTASPLLRATALLLAVLVLNSPAAADPLDVSADPVHLNETNPEVDRVGKLSWRGGLVLKWDNDNFKGLSALLVSGDGSQITSVTDTGYWVTMDLVYDQVGNLSDVKNGKIGRLLDPDGKRLLTWQDWDAESLARLNGESLVVAFEQKHRLWQYANGINAAATKSLDLHKIETKEWGWNDGVEALVTLANGELLAIVEGPETGDPTSDAYLLLDGDWKPLSYPHDTNFRPTGATRLPDGDVLVIERCYERCDEKMEISLRRLEADSLTAQSISSGKPLEVEEIAVLKAPLTVDNFEGVAARCAKSGEPLCGKTLVYLLSDDNGNSRVFDDNGKPKQRTLLLMFELKQKKKTE